VRVIAIVQARLGSTRLPGKVLAPLAGQPMLVRIHERLAAVPAVAEVVVATTTLASDDALARFCAARGLGCHRGPVDDIAVRLLGAVRQFGADAAVRVWGDCPLVDPDVIQAMVRALVEENLDFVHNSTPQVRTFPAGLDAEVYRRQTLEAVAAADDPFLREFPYEFIRARGAALRTRRVDHSEDLSAWHLTVDYPEDLAAVEAIYARLHRPGRPFGLDRLAALLRAEPALLARFAHHARNAEYFAKLEQRQAAGG
jgi:spore coat polysaccharide biosynthesis protein SpsF (cytidylyltransferase family)